MYLRGKDSLFLSHVLNYMHFFFILQNAYIEHREVKAAQGVKIAAKDLEKAIAGTWLSFNNGFILKEFFL